MDNLIAMSLPATDAESLYRNPIQEVARFLNEKHGDNYMVMNLCIERNYQTSFFGGRVERVPLKDHATAALPTLFNCVSRQSVFLVALTPGAGYHY